MKGAPFPEGLTVETGHGERDGDLLQVVVAMVYHVPVPLKRALLRVFLQCSSLPSPSGLGS